MNYSSINRVYAKARIPLWVSPCEAHGVLASMNFSPLVADELADWIARRMSMSFAAGYLGHKALPLSVQDLERQLGKMGYCLANAQEIAGRISDLHPLLHRKGYARRLMAAH